MYYGLKQTKKDDITKALREYDVIVTTPHMQLPRPVARNVRFHRIVVDESHLLNEGQKGAGSMAQKIFKLMQYEVLWPKFAPAHPIRSPLLHTFRRPNTRG
jgi:hypothetical protein